jgi:hypothetical protein
MTTTQTFEADAIRAFIDYTGRPADGCKVRYRQSEDRPGRVEYEVVDAAGHGDGSGEWTLLPIPEDCCPERRELDRDYDDVAGDQHECGYHMGTRWEGYEGRPYRVPPHARMGNRSYREDQCVGDYCHRCEAGRALRQTQQ